MEGHLCGPKVCRKPFLLLTPQYCSVYVDDDVTFFRKDGIKYALAVRTVSHVYKINGKYAA
jgi:hypothetical protein